MKRTACVSKSTLILLVILCSLFCQASFGQESSAPPSNIVVAKKTISVNRDSAASRARLVIEDYKRQSDEFNKKTEEFNKKTNKTPQETRDYEAEKAKFEQYRKDYLRAADLYGKAFSEFNGWALMVKDAIRQDGRKKAEKKVTGKEYTDQAQKASEAFATFDKHTSQLLFGSQGANPLTLPPLASSGFNLVKDIWSWIETLKQKRQEARDKAANDFYNDVAWTLNWANLNPVTPGKNS
jgi:hypothetical protein